MADSCPGRPWAPGPQFSASGGTCTLRCSKHLPRTCLSLCLQSSNESCEKVCQFLIPFAKVAHGKLWARGADTVTYPVSTENREVKASRVPNYSCGESQGMDSGWKGPQQTEPTPTQGSSCLPTPYLGPHSRSHPNSQPLEPPSCLRRQCYLQVRPGQGNHNPLAWHHPGLGPNLSYPSWAERGSGLPGQEKRLPGEGFLPISGCKENLFLGFGDSAWGLPNICLG